MKRKFARSDLELGGSYHWVASCDAEPGGQGCHKSTTEMKGSLAVDIQIINRTWHMNLFAFALDFSQNEV
jgi:hypothetical protein